MRRSRVASVGEGKATVSMPSECRWACVSAVWHVLCACVCVRVCMSHVFVVPRICAAHERAKHGVYAGPYRVCTKSHTRASPVLLSVCDLADCLPVSCVFGPWMQVRDVAGMGQHYRHEEFREGFLRRSWC